MPNFTTANFRFKNIFRRLHRNLSVFIHKRVFCEVILSIIGIYCLFYLFAIVNNLCNMHKANLKISVIFVC